MTHYLDIQGHIRDLEDANDALQEMIDNESLSEDEISKIERQIEINENLIDGYKHANDD